jgi:hypothetical protein
MSRTGTLLHLALCARPAGGNNVPVASYVTGDNQGSKENGL